MGFLKKRPPASSLQLPEKLANEARQFYGGGQLVDAFLSYADAVDKMHTMSVVAHRGSRLRNPSTEDQPILDGFTTSLGAALTLSPGNTTVIQRAEGCVGYLRQISQEARELGGDPDAYIRAAQDAESELRRRG